MMNAEKSKWLAREKVKGSLGFMKNVPSESITLLPLLGATRPRFYTQ